MLITPILNHSDKKKLVSNRTSIGASSEYTVTIIFKVKVTSETNNSDFWKIL